jgi:hypothetical protein
VGKRLYLAFISILLGSRIAATFTGLFSTVLNFRGMNMRAENHFDQLGKVGLAKRIAMLLAIVLVVGGALTPPLCAQVASNRYERELQPLIQRFVQQEQVPGLAIAIIKNNRIVYAHAFGGQNLSTTNDPMTTRSLFHMASITKLCVATSIMRWRLRWMRANGYGN